MITVHVVVRSGALEGESSLSFKPGKSGRYRGAETYLKKVKTMYTSAVKDYKKIPGNIRSATTGKWIEVMKQVKTDKQQESGFMSVTIVSDQSSPSLFPYTSEEISKLKSKYKVS